MYFLLMKFEIPNNKIQEFDIAFKKLVKWPVYTLYKTTDTADNKVFEFKNEEKENISGNLPNFPVNCVEYQNCYDKRLFAATDLGVFYTDRFSKDWIDIFYALPACHLCYACAFRCVTRKNQEREICKKLYIKRNSSCKKERKMCESVTTI